MSPGRDDADVGLEGVVAELEPNLVVALAGAAVGDGDAAFGVGDADLAARDDGAGEGGAWKQRGSRGLASGNRCGSAKEEVKGKLERWNSPSRYTPS